MGLKQISSRVWMWQVFNEERMYNFNSWCLKLDQGLVIIDPLRLEEEDLTRIAALGPVLSIIITNRDHRRQAWRFKQRFGAPILCHQDDAASMDIPVDGTFRNGERLYDSLQVIQVPHSKSPGESAIYWADEKSLFVGDSIIADPPGKLRLLPPYKYPDPDKAREGVRVLKGLEVQRFLPGDGEPILESAQEVLGNFLAAS
ncbi:MAG: hypothetical protein GMKNLPBB_00324 [Myxococcota bacterium]|nr:hypothetical protein [Myxococcota bacterium]